MLGFLIVTLFAFAAIFAVVVLTDSALLGARAYRGLRLRVACDAHYNLVVLKTRQLECLSVEPSFRTRSINRAIAPRQVMRQRSLQLPVAA